MLNILVSEDEGNDHLSFAWHLFRSSQEIYAISTQIREQFDPTLLVGIHNHSVQKNYFGTLNLVNTTFSVTSWVKCNFSGATSYAWGSRIIASTTNMENMVILWLCLLARYIKYLSPGTKAAVPLLTSSAKAYSTCQDHMPHLLAKSKGPGTTQTLSSPLCLWPLAMQIISKSSHNVTEEASNSFRLSPSLRKQWLTLWLIMYNNSWQGQNASRHSPVVEDVFLLWWSDVIYLAGSPWFMGSIQWPAHDICIPHSSSWFTSPYFWRNQRCINGDDPKKGKPGTICYDLVPTPLVPSSVGRKTLFASKPCGPPIFCVIGPSIYWLTNKIL
jgi:hypothetical protein